MQREIGETRVSLEGLKIEERRVRKLVSENQTLQDNLCERQRLLSCVSKELEAKKEMQRKLEDVGIQLSEMRAERTYFLV